MNRALNSRPVIVLNPIPGEVIEDGDLHAIGVDFDQGSPAEPSRELLWLHPHADRGE